MSNFDPYLPYEEHDAVTDPQRDTTWWQLDQRAAVRRGFRMGMIVGILIGIAATIFCGYGLLIFD